MSDYYYFKDKEEEFGVTTVLGDDYIHALHSIAKKRGLNITDEMVLQEIYPERKTKPKKVKKTKIPHD